jgi:hypothetical protein
VLYDGNEKKIRSSVNLRLCTRLLFFVDEGWNGVNSIDCRTVSYSIGIFICTDTKIMPDPQRPCGGSYIQAVKDILDKPRTQSA